MRNARHSSGHAACVSSCNPLHSPVEAASGYPRSAEGGWSPREVKQLLAGAQDVARPHSDPALPPAPLSTGHSVLRLYNCYYF